MDAANDLLCLVYASRATGPMSDRDLVELLRVARHKNSEERVTGLLLFSHGRFMQALEGPHATVIALYRKIAADPRHTEVTTLIKFRTSGRAFEGWSMGFANIDALPDDVRDGYSRFLIEDVQPEGWAQAPHQAMRLLLAFRGLGRALVET